ncbi:phosphinothricin acetyltransferase [Paenibacillus sp. BIHB 4019]|uniref:Phosphinothricin acetyltransferase n=1 Tax=Paenibacillus sp. BIHB 4019 TaxID=1870819 RepID=A0A1B2DR53_9BACL|nr:GNAT family N-acetyltransferase [Paenibacillus sp. BIHB 4019]ANY70192.1 phosphinothricin acetyltransferase [Paenibacillus sp. BIHB 4019]
MIREALNKDLPEILNIYNDAILHTTAVYCYEADTLNGRIQWFNNKKQDGYPVLVYEKGGRIAGFATFGPFRPWPAYKYAIEHSVYVSKDFRNLGIASKLMKELIDTANKREYATIVAGIDAANTPSIKLHEKLGFVYAGIIKKAGYKFGDWLDLAFYQLDLSGPKSPNEK